MTIAVVGGGLVGTRVAHTLGVLEREHVFLSSDREVDPVSTTTVVLAAGGLHAERATALIDHGISVVSVSDDLVDIIDLLALGDRAADAGATLFVGAACSPGMTALIARQAEKSFDSVEEVHTVVRHRLGRRHGELTVGARHSDPAAPVELDVGAVVDETLVDGQAPHLQQVVERRSATPPGCVDEPGVP